MNEKRILLVSHEMSVTGAPNSLLRQAGYFRSAGYAVDVWTYSGGALESRYRDAGFNPRPVEDDRKAIKAAYDARPGDYDLVICNTIRTYRAVDVLWHLGAPVAWFVRETKLLDEDFWLGGDFAALFRRFGNLYTVSPYAAGIVRRYNPHVRVICNSVPDAFVRAGTMTGRVRFGFIGSLIKVKGVDLLVAAFERIRQRFPNCELRIAGRLSVGIGEELSERTRNDPAIVWLGEVQGEDKRVFFDSIDVLCVPSLDEPSGLTVLEGAMYGKALITTDCTGANYIVDDSCGRIVRAGDAGALAVALSEFAAMDSSRLRSCCERARERYLEAGSSRQERERVLAMVEEVRSAPSAKGRLRLAEKPWFHVTRYFDGRRRYYLGGLRLLTLHGKPYAGSPADRTGRTGR